MSDEAQDSTIRTDGPALRAELKALADENKQLAQQVKGRALRHVLTEAGFDPETGEGKAIMRTYEGDEPTPEGIREFAEVEFGFEPRANLDAIAQARSDGEARLTMLSGGALPVGRGPTSFDEEIQIAERRAAETGDWDHFTRLNAQKLEAARRSHREYGGR